MSFVVAGGVRPVFSFDLTEPRRGRDARPGPAHRSACWPDLGALGALGGGGSILTVPALVYLLGQDTHAATTGSLLIVGITALAGMVAHYRAGRVRVVQGLVFGVLGIAGR